MSEELIDNNCFNDCCMYISCDYSCIGLTTWHGCDLSSVYAQGLQHLLDMSNVRHLSCHHSAVYRCHLPEVNYTLLSGPGREKHALVTSVLSANRVRRSSTATIKRQLTLLSYNFSFSPCGDCRQLHERISLHGTFRRSNQRHTQLANLRTPPADDVTRCQIPFPTHYVMR